ncbi:phage holin family protein [Metaclostridioides mangenotii]|uniref:phage holin family protein n=1 Tax=Metaclostridioides mangenotii TaxID=1540 RepID=UPI000691F424|nr:phage holin family protein [Clostridioides mangenotii]
MNIYSGKISTTIGVLGASITWLLGTWDIALKTLVTFIVLDFLLGMLKGWVLKKWSSNTGLIGIARKGVIFAVLIVAVYLDRLIGNGTWVFRTLVCYFYIANEGLSILENCSQIGIKVPVQIQNALEQLRDKEE